ncbi:MAG TPA: L-seryl-tRNA(Sec) selenium transferase, partial [Isosphaeraceae bacterium]
PRRVGGRSVMTDPPSLRSLPSVHSILAHAGLADATARLGRSTVVGLVRRAVEEARGAILDRRPGPTDTESLVAGVLRMMKEDRPHLRPVINATGILLNTGLGRAPLAAGAADAVAQVARGYCNLELDLASGGRGRRATSVEPVLRRLTGAEAATVVNNNAAATVLTLRALAAGREVIVSRGQLIEIGGSFRLPEIFEVSGARLREVGTTNRTRLDDYARAIGPETAALLRVHTSNYRVVGFTESVGIAELAKLAHENGLLAVDDVGSGVIRPGMPPGVGDEPTMAESIAAGADVVLGSGDKLLGGPQCGLMVGTSAAIARIDADPLMRAVRVDKMTLAALEATLRVALAATPGIPLWALIETSLTSLQDRAGSLAARLRCAGFAAEVEETEAMLGGGSTPGMTLASWAVRLLPPYPGGCAGLDESALARALRVGEPSVIPRVRAGAVLLDLRAVFPGQDEGLVDALRAAAGR